PQADGGGGQELADVIVQLLPDAGLLRFADGQDLALQLPAAGDVVQQPGKKAAVAYAQLADRQLQGKRAAVLPLPLHLPPDANDPGLAGPEIVLQILIVLAVVRLGHQHVDVSPDQFIRAVAEQARDGGIDRLDGPLGVDGDDAVHGGLDGPAQAGLAFAQRLVCPFALADVLGEDDDAADLARAVAPWADFPAQPLNGSVGPLETVLLA